MTDCEPCKLAGDEALPEQPITFVVDPMIDNAAVRVRWCLSRQYAQHIAGEVQRGAVHFLFIITDGASGEQRHWVPLAQEMTFVDLYRPGKTWLCGFVVTCFNPNNARDLEGRYLDPDSRYVLRRHSGDEDPHFVASLLELPSTMLALDVPREAFAKERPAWLRSWVNEFYRTAPKDDCDFRKRMLFAFTLQPVLYLAMFMIVMVVGVFCVSLIVLIHVLSGKKGVDYRAFWSTFRASNELGVKEALSASKGKGNFFLPTYSDVQGKDHYFLGFTPFIPLVFVLGVSCSWVQHSEITFSAAALEIFQAQIVMCLGITLMQLPAIIYRKSGKEQWFMSLVDEIRERRALARHNAEKEASLRQELVAIDAINAMVCHTGISPQVGSLPRRKRTLYLRYRELKASVCKPIAR